ncbi:GntR family transcriptional regulator [Jiangella ureilytica]|uniref:GntR family transcriptional regulator n=1 Tax=Jiangella ureilytica TaxID=2530374 RepID=A0A4R4RT50_9ACTN|nr:GntR family transcriptional regulator [Jiangella ureilytica]TDC52766.1 GntR family transcriptional regulator [Jiangella ureilytica]
METRATRTNHQFVREALRRGILTGHFLPGTRLVQADLAKELDVSTTPVREALRDLAADGLVRIDAYRGALVQSLSEEEIEEIYRLLKVLEPLSVERAVQLISPAELDEAEDILRRMVGTERGDSAEFVALDRQFHGHFAKAARSPRLRSILDSLRDNAAVYIAASFRDSATMVAHANEDHRALLEAMRNRDREAALDVENRHLEWAKSRWVETARAAAAAEVEETTAVSGLRRFAT